MSQSPQTFAFLSPVGCVLWEDEAHGDLMAALESADVEYRADVGMPQLGSYSGFLQEPVQVLAGLEGILSWALNGIPADLLTPLSIGPLS
jgi:hypothetical protein